MSRDEKNLVPRDTLKEFPYENGEGKISIL